MPTVYAKEYEKFEGLLRRFNRKVSNAGILRELRDRETYEKPSTRRRKKKISAIKRAQRDRQKIVDSQTRKY